MGIDKLAMKLLLAVCTGIACTSCSEMEKLPVSLPFIVRIDQVTIPPALRASSPESGDAVGNDRISIPPRFDDEDELRRAIRSALDEAGVFTLVVTGEDPGLPADLEMDVAVIGNDFGPGTADLGGAFSSTFAWLFGGHFSWLIPNRSFPDSNVKLNVWIRKPADEHQSGLYYDRLDLDRLRLSLSERANVADWFVNILLPPWWGDGDPEIAGATLATKSVEYFAENEPGEIANRLPGQHYLAEDCFLVYDIDEDRLIIMSSRLVNQLELVVPGKEPRVFNADEMKARELVEKEVEEIQASLSSMRITISAGFYYQVDLGNESYLDGDNRAQLIQIVTSVGEREGHWTIIRPPPIRPPPGDRETTLTRDSVATSR